MTTEEKFRAAVNVIRSLPKNGSYQPSHELMLRFYGYFKQATEGPCKVPRPAFWEVVRKMKWEAWSKLGSMPREDAMNNYVEELKKIVETMSYTDNVASFLGSLGSFYENVPPEDLELLVGPIIERIRSQPGSPLSGSPFASREASPDRLQPVLNGRSHITSSLETSPASSYSASPLPPDGEEDDDEEEFIDTVEAEPERITKEPPSMTKVPVPNKKSIIPNGIPNGHISPPVMNGMNNMNGLNGYHEDKENRNNIANTERGRPRERSNDISKKHFAMAVAMNDRPVAAVMNNVVNAEGTARPVEVSDLEIVDQRQRVVRLPFTQDISEPIGEAVLRLQQDLERVTGRLTELETALSVRNAAVQSQVKPKSAYPLWWPFKDISPRLVAFLVLWPFFVNVTIALLQRRHNNRLM